MSVHMEEFDSHWTEFDEIWYLSFFFFENILEKIQISLKYDKSNCYFTWKCFNIYDNIWLSSS
jgi:hypothetical protein